VAVPWTEHGVKGLRVAMFEAASGSWTATYGAADTGTLGCPCSAWPATATPANPSWPDSAAVELGVRLRVDVDGVISGVRFYKGAANTGTHTGSLSSTTGAAPGARHLQRRRPPAGSR
jgi:hypothetical protein